MTGINILSNETGLADRFQVVYIAGYGRSGSTLLDTILSNHAAVFGAGELADLFGGVRRGEMCSCGVSLTQCALWREVLCRVSRAVPEIDWRTAEAVTLQTETLGIRARKHGDAYRRLWGSTCQAIAEVSGRRIIVDSSKSCRLKARRLPLLAGTPGAPVKALHLVRDPRGVMWSTYRGSNRELERGAVRRSPGGMLRGVLSWMSANLTVELTRLRAPDLEVHRVRYEDLASDPFRSVRRIGGFLGLDMQEVLGRLDRGEVFDSGHGVGGNRMRRQGRIVMRFDNEWEQQLPKSRRMMAHMAWPLMRAYGYGAGPVGHAV